MSQPDHFQGVAGEEKHGGDEDLLRPGFELRKETIDMVGVHFPPLLEVIIIKQVLQVLSLFYHLLLEHVKAKSFYSLHVQLGHHVRIVASLLIFHCCQELLGVEQHLIRVS